MFLTVDYGGPFTGFVMKETRGVKENHVFHCKDLHIESETQSYLQALCCRRTSECYKLCYFKSNFLTSGWKISLKAVEMWGVGYLKWDTIDKTASPSPALHRDTQITLPLHYLVLKSPCSSIILYTYTKLRTPVFSVKRCYAYLYCMYVYPFFCYRTVLLYLPQSQM